MNIGDMERWVDYSTPIKGVVNDEFNAMERWENYSTPPLVFNEGGVVANTTNFFLFF